MTDNKHRKLHVDLDKHRVRVGSKKYKWEDVTDPERYREMLRLWVPIRKGHASNRLLDKNEDRHLIGKLERAVEHAKDRQERHKEEKQKLLQKAVLAAEEAEQPTPKDSESAQKQSEQPTTAKAEILRDKHGVKLYSVGGEYHLDVCVNNAKKYPGCYSFRIFAAGKGLRYTFGKNEMRALAKEVARAFSAKELRDLLWEGRT